MRKKINYKNKQMNLKVIKDFLPPPQDLILREDGQKITIILSKDSINFFKMHAKKIKSPYQKIIRKVLDSYVNHYK